MTAITADQRPLALGSETAGGVTFLFPGQGSQHPRMLDEIRPLAAFRAYHQAICDEAKIDIATIAGRGGQDSLRQNRLSSLSTILVSLVLHDEWRRRQGTAPECLAGYSVGQWTALYVAGVVDLSALIRTVLVRADFMDACVKEEPCGMYSVLGLPLVQVEEVLNELRQEGHRVYVSNLNCVGNNSIAGTLAGLEVAISRLAALGAKKLSPVSVSGAWHCPILGEAEIRFAGYLEGIDLKSPTVPVADNVTGQWLPKDAVQMRKHLAQHLTHPVQWHSGIRHCAAKSRRFIEFGYGDSLTKMGFFIDRTATFERFHASDPTPGYRMHPSQTRASRSRCAE